MEKDVLVLCADKPGCDFLCNSLEQSGYPADAAHTFEQMEKSLAEKERRVMVIDLDTVTASSRTFRELARRNPKSKIIVLSAKRFHPDLEEAMRCYIYARLTKPVDLDELIFWLKSIFENNYVSE